MYVCICNAVTESEIREAAGSGADDLWALQAELGVASGCGSCKDVASAILTEIRSTAGDIVTPQPVVYRPAMA